MTPNQSLGKEQVGFVNAQLSNLIELQQEYLDLKDSLRSSQAASIKNNNSPVTRSRARSHLGQMGLKMADEDFTQVRSMPKEMSDDMEARLLVGLNLFNLPIDINILQNPTLCLDREYILGNITDRASANLFSPTS